MLIGVVKEWFDRINKNTVVYGLVFVIVFGGVGLYLAVEYVQVMNERVQIMNEYTVLCDKEVELKQKLLQLKFQEQILEQFMWSNEPVNDQIKKLDLLEDYSSDSKSKLQVKDIKK